MERTNSPDQSDETIAGKSTAPKTTAEAWEMLKASGILNRDLTVDQIMELSEQLSTGLEERGVFVFTHFLYRPCNPF